MSEGTMFVMQLQQAVSGVERKIDTALEKLVGLDRRLDQLEELLEDLGDQVQQDEGDAKSELLGAVREIKTMFGDLE